MNETVFFGIDIPRYCVIKADGTYAGMFCISLEEAIDLASVYEGSVIYELKERK